MSRFLRVALLLAAPALATGAVIATAAPPAQISATDLALLNRLTWGANELAAAEFAALGRDRWIDRQLHPGAQG